MGKNVILTIILVFLIVADVSSAAFSLNFRKLVSSSPREDPSAKVSPISSPASSKKQSSPVSRDDKGNEKQKQRSPAGEKSNDKPAANSRTPVTPPTDAKEHNNSPKEEVKEHNNTPKEEVKEKEKGETKTDTPVGGNESCDAIGKRCQDLKSMIACVKSFDYVSKALVLLIQNKGDTSLKVDLRTSSFGNKQKVIEIPKHQTKQVDLPLANGGSNEIRLHAGSGPCVLHLDAPMSPGNVFQWIPSYSKFVTPIYGAYLMLLTTFIAGGVWACCWFRKRKRPIDIPYQELEMSMPESAVAVDTAEGWDQVWDDDWDEEKAVRSPGGHNISANGLTSRTLKKDDWEDWDD